MLKKHWILVVCSLMLYSASMGQQRSGSLFADHRAHNVGDILTILVVEYAAASSEAITKTNKQNDHGVSAYGGAKNSAFSPAYGLRGNINNGFRGDATVQRQGTLRTKLTATIQEILSNGNLIIQGNRDVEVNGEKEQTTLTGVVRPQDVSFANTVYSYQLADVQISYKGKGVVNTGQRPGFLTRILTWIF